MSSWLKPQLETEEPLGVLETKPFYSEQKQIHEAHKNDPVPDAWPDILASFTEPLTDQDIAKATVINYKWTQADSKVTVTFSESVDCEITGDHISSRLISGTFFKQPKNLIKTENSLEFDVDEYWPVIISGGSDIDGFSAFLLARLSLANDVPEFYEFWLLKSANTGFMQGQISYAWAALTVHRAEEAMYWFYRSAERGSEFAQIVLAQFLMEATNANRDPALAENLLVNLVKHGAGDAWYYLGYLHVSPIDGFQGNPELGVKYLQKSVEVQEDPVAMKLLGQCMVNGFGCKKDVAGGMKMIEMAAQAVPTEEQDGDEEAPKEKKQKVSWLDIGAVALATLCVATTGVLFWNNLRRK